MTSSLTRSLASIDWWKVLWPVFFASGGLLVLSSRFEKIVKGQFHKWHLFRISKRETSKRNPHATVFVKTVQISSIHIHPIKSLRPVSVSSAKLTSRGIEGDRCLMLVRPSPSSGQYRFLTQRQCPKLATIHASLPRRVGNTTMVEISNFDHSRKMLVDISYSNIIVHKKSSSSSSVKYYKAGIWDDVVQVVDLGDEASLFVQSLIASNHDKDNNDDDDDDEDYSNVRLVMQVPNDNRRVDERYCPLAALDVIGRVPKVSLTDGFPILIASEESLQELNRRLVEKGKDAIPMSRFRPNIVVKGTVAAFDEDEWKAIQIVGNNNSNNNDEKDDDNGPILHVVKGCPRCKQSCTDQITGERFEEPLETLKDFRALGTTNKEDVYFAQNVVLQPGHEGQEISVGDTVRILTRGRPVWDMGTVQAE